MIQEPDAPAQFARWHRPSLLFVLILVGSGLRPQLDRSPVMSLRQWFEERRLRYALLGAAFVNLWAVPIIITWPARDHCLPFTGNLVDQVD